MEEEIGRCSLNTNLISNKKFELAVIDESQKEIGKLYLEFYDEQMDIKEEMNPIEEKSESNPISEETAERVRVKNE